MCRIHVRQVVGVGGEVVSVVNDVGHLVCQKGGRQSQVFVESDERATHTILTTDGNQAEYSFVAVLVEGFSSARIAMALPKPRELSSFQRLRTTSARLGRGKAV